MDGKTKVPRKRSAIRTRRSPSYGAAAPIRIDAANGERANRSARLVSLVERGRKTAATRCRRCFMLAGHLDPKAAPTCPTPRRCVLPKTSRATPRDRYARLILVQGVSALTAAQRLHWARLLVSFGVRTPETLRDMGPKEVTKAFEIVKSAAKGQPEDERRVTAIIQANIGLFRRNFPLQAAMDLSRGRIRPRSVLPRRLGA